MVRERGGKSRARRGMGERGGSLGRREGRGGVV